MHERVSLAVLAGGESRRMGTSKSLLRLNGKPILAGLMEQLAWKGPTILITAPGQKKPDGHELFDIEATDPVAGQGPLRGVLTALEHASTPLAVIIPVDMPGLTTESLLLLAKALEHQTDTSLAMFQRADQFVESLPAAFAVQSASSAVRKQLADGRSALRDLPHALPTSLVAIPDGWPKSLWVNLNRPEDVEAYLETVRIGATA